jgi:hypothetical protein
MAVSIPSGYVTRSAAPRTFNRSKRALERDLDNAYRAVDEDVLVAFRLVTKDGVKREAREVTTELVEELKNDGMNPVWWVSEAWLESTYGRRGEPKPVQATKTSKRIEIGSARTKANEREARSGRSEHSDNDDVYLPDDIEFLKERIRTLEREKVEESIRNEKREAKLFEQLEVKDKQISAWDEVTQGIMRGLATGAIQPTLVSGTTPKEERGTKQERPSTPEAGQHSRVIDAAPGVPKKPAAKKGSVRKPRQKKTTNKRLPKWYEMPTFKNVLTRR